MTIVQPVPRPHSLTDYLAIKDQLIDTWGRPLSYIDCPECHAHHATVDACATELPCRECGSRGARCRRPSEHDAGEWHASRVDALERLLAGREANGEPVPARWPDDQPIGEVMLQEQREPPWQPALL